jgi:intracellular sulfur oxidation DsrE/DsrF family protein
MDNEKEIAGAIAAAAPVVKKKPGRPKKKVVTMPIEVHGIVDAPVNAGDVLEMVYSNPSMFKKLFHLLKQFEVSEVEMVFDPAGMKIITKDHLGKSNIYAFINGACMNLYYCRELIRICIQRDNLANVLGPLDKNNYKLTFLLKEENYRSMMYVIVKDMEYDSTETFEIPAGFKPNTADPAEPLDDDTDYPLKFTLSSKHFKNQINKIRALSSTFTIQKTGLAPLQFTFEHAKKVNWNGVYDNSDRINLRSAIGAEDILTVSVAIDYMKPFSNSNIGEEVQIAVDKHKRISFSTSLDKKGGGGVDLYACRVQLFTPIIEFRHANTM